MSVLLTSVAVWLLTGTVPAQSKGTSTAVGIDAYCKKIDAFTQSAKAPDLVAADTSDYTDGDAPAKWRLFATEAELEKFRETTETYTIALNWRKKGKIVASNFTLFSPSGDWAKYVFQYFREDGTLALAKSELRTFMGDFSATQVLYFSSKGKVIKTTVKYADLKTGKPKKPTKDFLGTTAGFLKEKDYYLTTGKLPFAKLAAAK